jgi:hypothetical protein
MKDQVVFHESSTPFRCIMILDGTIVSETGNLDSRQCKKRLLLDPVGHTKIEMKEVAVKRKNTNPSTNETVSQEQEE